MRIHDNVITTGSALLISAWLLTGCTTMKSTTTARSATEQLLLSTATDHALQATSLEMFAGRKVFVDASYFDSYDAKYVMGSIRDALSRAGALLTDTATNSDIVLEARSGALAIDPSETFFGIPGITVPVPLSGPVKTPDVALYRSVKQRAVAKFALLARSRQSTAHVYSSGPLVGNSFDNSFQVFFIPWHRTDVPENQLTQEQAQKYQTCFPQYDLANMPGTNGPAK
jgi:hypothetical protein